jgi:hypothetical protein
VEPRRHSGELGLDSAILRPGTIPRQHQPPSQPITCQISADAGALGPATRTARFKLKSNICDLLVEPRRHSGELGLDSAILRPGTIPRSLGSKAITCQISADAGALGPATRTARFKLKSNINPHAADIESGILSDALSLSCDAVETIDAM